MLEQPGQFAWQVFDQKVKHLLRDEYKIRQITKVTADSIEDFAQKLDGVNASGIRRKRLREWNAAVCADTPFNPNIKDGRCTAGLAINKSNWANTLDAPPFEGYAVTCGVTFTFGGLRVNTDAAVLSTDYQPIMGFTPRANSLAACSISIIPAVPAHVRRRVRQDRGLFRGRRNCRESKLRLQPSVNFMANSGAWPTELRLRKDRKILVVSFDPGESYELPAEYLRIRSPSAEVQGHSPAERRVVAGKRDVQISELHPVGNYAVRLVFDDQHSTGIFTWDYLLELARNHETYWSEYLGELQEKRLSRAPG